MDAEMQEIVTDFVTEAEESLDRIDPLFVDLETKGEDQEVLNDIFRCLHTLKGAAGFLGFQKVVDVAHASESILKKLRDGEIRLTKHLVDVVLRSVDTLRVLIGHVKHGEEASEDTGPLVAALADALATAPGKGGAAVAPATPVPPTPAPEAPRTVSAPPTPAPEAPRTVSAPPTPVPEAPRAVSAPTIPVPEAPRAVSVLPSPAPAGPAAKGEHLPAPPGPEGQRSVPDRRDALQNLRVDIGRIDKVMDLTGEVVLARNRLLTLVNAIGSRYGDDPAFENLSETVSFLDLVTSDMQLSVLKMRMQPLQKVFGKFPRVVRDIASGMGKDIELKISGEETEVDRSVIEHIGDPLIHILRNAIDHGIEAPDVRKAAGKKERGVISIDASQKGTQVLIQVSDDGHGIDIDRVKRKAVENGLVTAEDAERMTDEAAIHLIFQPGFTTMDVATELSGRGVGMDVVLTSISRLNGYVEIRTNKGAGTTFRISIPLTLAIIQSLMVRAGGGQYAIPLALVEEILRVTPGEIAETAGQKVLVIRDRVHPFFELAELIGKESPPDPVFRYAVVVAVGDNRFCLGVDKLVGEEEVVIKPIDGLTMESSHMIGATITGEGKVVLILDLASVSRSLSGANRT
ncbi:MAG: chemotaxis protein CheA [bacterium]|jgi:two-component system chemotaxis sensor kinase CheA